MNIFQKHRSNLLSLRAKIKTLALSAAVGFSVLSTSQAQAQTIQFDNAVVNTLGLSSLAPLYAANPTFADLDNDGDMDMLVGTVDQVNYSGEFRYYENTGSASSVDFSTAPLSNPFGLTAQVFAVFPEFVDLDGDGDMDILAGVYGGDFNYFENTGTASAPAFGAAQTNPFGLTAASGFGFPTFADLDNDGDMDMLANDFSGFWSYYENTGTASAPAFAAAQANPFGLTAIVGNPYANPATPAFTDLDKDGDMDIMYGTLDSTLRYLPNIGTATAPSFGAAVISPFGLTQQTDYFLAPAFADLDADGDMDMLAGSNYSDFFYFQNISCFPLNPLMSQNDTLQANNIGNLFRWYNCADSSLVSITSVPYYLPNTSGNFYAVVFNGNCEDTTACFSFIHSSVTDINNPELLIYPNPTNGLLNVEIPAELQDAELRVISVSGQTVFNQSNLQAGRLGLNLAALPAGLYTVEIKNSKLVARQKFNKF